MGRMTPPQEAVSSTDARGAQEAGPDGVTDLRTLGIDHFHMDEWECTYNHDQLDLLEDEMVSSPDPWGVHPVYTLIEGPMLYAVRVPTEFTEDGDAEEHELRLFSSADDAIAALSRAQVSA